MNETNHTQPTIDRRNNLSVEEFQQEYLIPLRPVILENSISAWEARRWTPAWFRETFPDKQVLIDGKPWRLADFIDVLLGSSAASPAPYLRNIDLPTAFAELMPYVLPPMPYAQPDRLRGALLPKNFPQQNHFLDLFIGGPGAGFPYLHYDVHHLLSYLTQVYGEKEFLLFTPDQGQFLYPNHETPDVSDVENPLAPDLTKYPLFAKARPTRVVLRPGDTLFMPCGYWHVTRILSPCITLGFDQLCAANWRAFMGDQFARRSGSLKAHALLGYLMASGAALSLAERITGRWTGRVDTDLAGQLRDARTFRL